MRLSSRPSVLPGDSAATLHARWAPDDLVATMHPFGVPRSAEETRRIDEENARAEIEQRIQEAQAAGYEAGRLDGELAASAHLRTAIVAAEDALDQIRAGEAKWQESVSENISALALAVARHIVGHELRSDPTNVAELVKRAIAEFPIDQPLRVRVSPLDLSLLSQPGPEGGALVAIAPNRDVRWMADSRIQPGGCVVEGRERIIDGRVDTALERMYRRLTDSDA